MAFLAKFLVYDDITLQNPFLLKTFDKCCLKRKFIDFSGYPAVVARLLKASRTRNIPERLAFAATARRCGVEKDL